MKSTKGGMRMDDGVIVDLFLSRDERAIDAIREKYGARLYASALRILSDPSDAEECISDAYYQAWVHIPPHEPRQYLFPFLSKLVKASALNRVKASCCEKRSAAFVELTEELESVIPSSSSTEDEVESKELSRAIDAFLKGLPTEKRAVFLQRYWEMLPIKQIAEGSGYSESRIKTLLHRLRNELKKFLIREGFLQ